MKAYTNTTNELIKANVIELKQKLDHT